MTGLLFGHAALLVATLNRVHAFSLPRRLVTVFKIAYLLFLLVGLLAAIWWCLDGHLGHVSLVDLIARQLWLLGYALICGTMTLLVPAIWLIRE